MNRRHFAIGALSLLGAASFAGSARAEVTVLHPHVRVVTQGIDVDVLFAFSSKKSFSFERDALQAWVRQLPDDVDLTRVHSSGSALLVSQQRAFYTMQSLRRANRLLLRAFESDLSRDGTIALLRSAGIDPQTTQRAYDSAAVTALMKQADARASAYEAEELPTVVVDGRFRVTGGVTAILPTVDALVKRVRIERAAH